MAIYQHIRHRYIDYIRSILGDKDKLLFTDDELNSYFDKYSSVAPSGDTLTAYNNRFRIGCCSIPTPVWQLGVSSGVDESVYIIDDVAGTVTYDPDDPDCTGAAPDDGDTIEVTYYTMDTNALLSELFFILSSSHAKLVVAYSMMGVGMSLDKLSDAFYAQSVRYASEKGCGGGCCV